METKARYTLIGLFTLAAIIGVFGFVYWLHNTGGIGQRSVYRVQFDSSVSGLLAGSGVLFNGVRVGEVATLQLNPDQPQQVLATIAIDPATPVRTDTVVGMDFQGLTGAPVIVLTGGTASAPALSSSDGSAPLLKAPPGAGQSFSQSARDALGRLDKIMADNADPLRETIGNIKTFSEALSRNSDRVDGILAGVERMTGGAGKGRAPIFTLTPPREVQQCAKPLDLQLIVPEPPGLLSLNSDKIPVAGAEPVPASFSNGQFSDNIPAMLQVKIIEALENSHCFRSVTRVIDGVEADVQLIFDIRNFNVKMGPAPEADVEISAKVVSAGKITGSQVYHEKAALKAVDAAGAAAALDSAYGKVMLALVPWVARQAAERAEPKHANP